MRSSPAIAIFDSVKITIVIAVLGLQLVTFWMAGITDASTDTSIDILVNFTANASIAPPALEQVGQIDRPSISIGSPLRTIGSGTR